MNENTQDTADMRSPWVAALLSFIMPGIGQVYCGRLVRGLTIGVLYGLAIPAALGLLAYVGPAPTVWFGLLAVAAAFGVVAAAVVDAYRLAVRTRPDYERKAFNRPAVYLLIGLLIQGSSIGYGLHVRASLFEAFRVTAASMYPTIGIDDRILANKTAYRRVDPQRGDIILFRPPAGNWRDTYIKRIVAIGGDTVEIRNGEVYINNQKLPREPAGPAAAVVSRAGNIAQGQVYTEHNGRAAYRVLLADTGSAQESDFEETQVPQDHCFVLGDARNNSLDSRQFGPIPYGSIKGRADYLYCPAGDWSRFGRLE